MSRRLGSLRVGIVSGAFSKYEPERSGDDAEGARRVSEANQLPGTDTKNEAEVQGSTVTCHDGLETTETVLKDRIVASPVVHADETGCDVNGKLWWIHSLGKIFDVSGKFLDFSGKLSINSGKVLGISVLLEPA